MKAGDFRRLDLHCKEARAAGDEDPVVDCGCRSSGDAQGPVHLVAAGDFRQRDGFGHRYVHPCRAVPSAAASMSLILAPSPMARNAASSALRALTS